MSRLFDLAEFVRKAQRRLRYGDLSRMRLQLLRLEWKGDRAECDWLMRPPDPWDADLPTQIAETHQSLQALKDALTLRNLIFDTFPGLDRAELRMFRVGVDQSPVLIMTGSVERINEVLPRVASVAMQAKLCGFRFSLAEGVLESVSAHSVNCA